jgi:hypothetical protein
LQAFYLEVSRRGWDSVFLYFRAMQMFEIAKWTGDRLEETAAGSTQAGQCTYSHHLPGVSGGAALAAEWSKYETIGVIDADNHAFAADWQYAIESINYRTLGANGYLSTQWENPMRYHMIHGISSGQHPLNAAMWQRRQLDSRWLTVARGADVPGDTAFLPTLNITHREVRLDIGHGNGVISQQRQGRVGIGGGTLPAHWIVNDKLSQLAQTIGVKQPRSPLALIGESDADWTMYFGTFGKFRDAGLPIGGGVNISFLDDLAPELIPALVWMPAEKVSNSALNAVKRKLAQGVPLLIIGKIPQPLADVVAGDFVPANEFGLTYHEAAPANDQQVLLNVNGANVAAPIVADAAAVGLIRAASNWSVNDGAKITPLVTRGGRLAVGKIAAPEMKVVAHSLVYPLHQLDDAALRKIAVEEFLQLCGDRVITPPEGASGYAFVGEDNKTYQVLLNLEPRPQTFAVNFGAAIDLLSGKKLAAENGAAQVTLPAGAGTVIYASE